MKKEIGFEREEKKKCSIEDFVDKWVLLLTNSGSYSGKMIDIIEGDVVLLPYLKVGVKTGLEKYEIELEGIPFLYAKQNIRGIRSTSEEETKNYCDIMNRRLYLQHLREENEIRELEQRKITGEITNLNKKIIL